MTAEVTKLVVHAHKEKFEPDAKIIEKIETLLERAKQGYVRAVAIAVIEHDGLTPAASCSTAWENTGEYGTTFGLTHAIAQLSRRWEQENLDQARPDGR
jgi:hypothetical protein